MTFACIRDQITTFGNICQHLLTFANICKNFHVNKIFCSQFSNSEAMFSRSTPRFARACSTGKEKIVFEIKIPVCAKTALNKCRVFVLTHWYHWDKLHLWKFSHNNPWSPAEGLAVVGFAFGALCGQSIGRELYRYDADRPAWTALLATFVYVPAHAAFTIGSGLSLAFMGLHAPFCVLLGLPFACDHFARSVRKKEQSSESL
jgi:hypothetical protein